ncbi:MAG: hypothetical protein DHS80DRAFT_23760 [Piptocephalis tieghemiana]|nr:MAG: hypothetical protein DHS80DRAFT_23760 [Piptocephalis tieghemiana]
MPSEPNITPSSLQIRDLSLEEEEKKKGACCITKDPSISPEASSLMTSLSDGSTPLESLSSEASEEEEEKEEEGDVCTDPSSMGYSALPPQIAGEEEEEDPDWGEWVEAQSSSSPSLEPISSAPPCIISTQPPLSQGILLERWASRRAKTHPHIQFLPRIIESVETIQRVMESFTFPPEAIPGRRKKGQSMLPVNHSTIIPFPSHPPFSMGQAYPRIRMDPSGHSSVP